ncbi:hypothetical protein [Nitrosomonas sp. Nm166]|uniref:hypothetical protein n=1 Tax=Nitrosomonas sp. Nm166 TaxID=1881054 RepID=UPI0008E46AE3|nr:hypothetical protein [Nitrosomonas sp. Nm166]SFF23175.1 hypothetical protein SAMN05428977_10782 [Nitrosomonas sp. Nm166]
MKNLFKLIFGLNNAQTRLAVIIFRVIFIFFLALALLNIALWLLSSLWNISHISPLGGWSFLSALLGALGLAFFFWRHLTKTNRPPLSQHTATFQTQLRDKLTTSSQGISEQESLHFNKTPLENRETPVTIRNRILGAITKVENSGELAHLNQTEELLLRLVELDPREEEWAHTIRWQIADLRRRFS